MGYIKKKRRGDVIIRILITSISNKVPLIESVRNLFINEKIDCEIIGADSNESCVARYFVNSFWLMPLLDEMTAEDLIAYCKSHDIKVIFPTREGELAFFAQHKGLLEENGIYVMVSNSQSLKKVQDKLIFYEYLSEKGYPVIPTTTNIQLIQHTQTYVVKERFGAGSKNLHLNVSVEEAREVANELESPIFQPFIKGREYSVDVYVDRMGKSKGAVVRERILVIDGESKVTRTVRHSILEELAMKLAEDLKLQGHVMFQIIIDHSGNPHIVECNPRFGGASTLSVTAGLDSFYWFLIESQGKSLDDYPFNRSEKELTQVRYEKDLIL